MGIWDFVNSTTDILKRNAPDLTPVKEASRTSYDMGRAAASKIDDAVRVNGLQKVNQYMPNNEARAKIALCVTMLGKNAAYYAAEEGVRWIPGPGLGLAGGKAVTTIIYQTINDMKSENFEEQEMKAMQEATGKPKNEAGGCKQLLNQAEMFKRNVEFSSQKAPYSDSCAVHEPEDLLRMFRMYEFIRSRHLNDLIISEIRRGKQQ